MKHTNPGKEQFQRKLETRALQKRTLRVLAVDDEPSILELLQAALAEFENYEISVAGSASEALQAIESSETPFDCFLLDIQMPETNGIELLRRIRQIPEHAETPAIMLTAMSGRKYVEDAFLQGAFDYVSKPFDFFELRSRMHAAHLLMQERIKARRTSASVKNLREELDHNQQFSFEDPLTIDGLERCLKYVEFDNYIEQLSRGRLFESWVTAIKLQDAEFRFDLNDFGGFRRTMADLGRSIELTTGNSEAVFSYRGGGAFLVVVHGRDRAAGLPKEDQLNHVFSDTLGRRGASGYMRAVMSPPVSMRSISKTGAFAAMNNAIEKVDGREKALRKGTEVEPQQRCEVRVGRKEKSQKRLFDTVLREMYGNETYLAGK
ncbi:Transcriptional activator protein CzcR [Ruegeria sp. THAF57]|uniref:response regulator n=1 Tax=unclassified Ruegeria TaxID=2625375 RepID=UPI0014894CF5|nr:MULTISPECIES: response regulator [unclassified Ruegeria]CAD0183460.1 Transcriptional activator protein CzcR [Ruegeria sp. THAF57]